MELELFSNIIRELILEHDRVSLPGMGSYIAEMAPSVFSDRARVIHPPFRRILFRTSEIWNDGLLEDAYAKERGITKEEASKDIAQLTEKMRLTLNSDKSFPIPGFGTMRATDQNDYFFVADKELFTYLEGFGLEPVNIKVPLRKGRVENLTGKPEPVKFDLDKFARKMDDQDDSFTVEVAEEKIDNIKEEKIEVPQEEMTLEERVAEKKLAEKKVNEKAEQKAEVVTEVEKEVVTEVEQVAVKEVVEKEVSREVAEERVSPEDKLAKSAYKEVDVRKMPEVKESSETKKSVVKEVAKESAKEVERPVLEAVKPQEGSTFIKKLVITLSIIFIILLAAVLLYVFKDDLKPLWETILYSKEEREILRNAVR